MNDLPDPNYATLKYLMGHLDRCVRYYSDMQQRSALTRYRGQRVRQHETVNQMTSSNLAIVFGPNLLGAPPAGATGGGMALADMSWQCKCVETILDHYAAIFVVRSPLLFSRRSD